MFCWIWLVLNCAMTWLMLLLPWMMTDKLRHTPVRTCRSWKVKFKSKESKHNRIRFKKKIFCGPNYQKAGPNLERVGPNFGRVGPNFGRLGPKCGKDGSKYHQSWPEVPGELDRITARGTSRKNKSLHGRGQNCTKIRKNNAFLLTIASTICPEKTEKVWTSPLRTKTLMESDEKCVIHPEDKYYKTNRGWVWQPCGIYHLLMLPP